MNRLAVFFFIIFVFSLYGGTNYYIGKRIFKGFNYLFPGINTKIYVVIFTLITLLIFIAILPLPLDIKRIISWISYHWVGIFVYLLLFFLVSDLAMLLGRVFKIAPNPMPQSIDFYKSLIVIILTVGVVGYGMYNAKQTKHVFYDIQIKNTSLEGEMKIVLISDLHLGAINSEKRLQGIVDSINKLKPDIVCIAGDIFNDDFNLIKDPEEVIKIFRNIKATYGAYAILGNHDAGKTLNKMIELLEKSNINLLNDEYVIIDKKLVLVGRLDPAPIGGFGELERKEDIGDILVSADANMPVIVIDHTPSNIEQYDKKIDLVLSGHTHKGQMFPFNFITNAIFTIDYGHYQKDEGSPHFIVTSGVGTWGPPIRVGSSNEIVSILLH